MCVICASIPVAVAAGAKLNASQLDKPVEQRKPISKVTGIVVGLLITTSLIYHTLRWQN